MREAGKIDAHLAKGGRETAYQREDVQTGESMKKGEQPVSRTRRALRAGVEIPADGAVLQGEMDVPAGAGGLVVFAHGSGSSRHSPRNQMVARVLRESGLGTLLIDLLTREEERADSATGGWRFNIDLLARRLVAVIRWLGRQDETAGLKTGFFGASTGGGAALVAAAALGDLISAVVSRGGRPDLAGGALPKVTCPVLLIVGGEDDVVLRLNEEAAARMNCPKELRLVPGATHLFEEPGALDQVAEWSAEWFSNYMGGNT